jgi:hypothetical protein
MNQNKPFLSLSLFISGTCFSNRKPTNTLLFFEHITNCVPYSNYMPPKSLVGMRLGRIGSHPWAATKASHLLFLHHQFCLWVHLDKRFYHCKMFEKLCSRILGSANLSLYFLLVALIEFVNQWSLCVNCPPFPAQLNWNPSCIFYHLSYGGHFCFCLGYLVHEMLTPVAFRSSLYKQQSCDTCLEKFLPGVIDDISGKDPRMAHWKLTSIPSKWLLWKLYPLFIQQNCIVSVMTYPSPWATMTDC